VTLHVTKRRALPLAAITGVLAFGIGGGLRAQVGNPETKQAPHGTLTAKQRCFGAAARDPQHQPCNNPKLRLSVVPPPSIARITPAAPCVRIKKPDAPELCAFGVRSRKATATIALVGDSHAVHWRAALAVVARAKRWRALTVYESKCPFTDAITILFEPARSECARWKVQVKQWFDAHPEISTVFVSQHSGGAVVVPPGQDAWSAKVAGYMDAWNALPASVKHIIVIRDVPYSEHTTQPCVARAIARHRAAGRACALPRRTALRPDPALVAAGQLRSPRVQGVDLTSFMCGKNWCYPVVGGVLVHKDGGHLTRAFSATLGPFLLRAVNRLMAGWG
jgi:SGNH domain (fused to AT3 domains)